MSLPKSVYERKPKRLPKSLGFSRYALDFDGAEDFIDMGDCFQPVRVSCMAFVINRNVTKAAATVGGKTNLTGAGGNEFGLWFDGSPQEVTFQLDNGTSVVNTGVSSVGMENKLFHLAGTYDGSAARLFVNGVEEASDAITGDIYDAGVRMLIGTDESEDYFFEGVIDEFLVYNRALSSREIKHNILNYHAPIRDGLIGWWRLEEGIGTTVEDLSGGGNDGTLKPAASPPVWTDVKKWELRSEVGL